LLGVRWGGDFDKDIARTGAIEMSSAQIIAVCILELSGREEWHEAVAADAVKWAKVIRAAHIKVGVRRVDVADIAGRRNKEIR
jgi:hypothetical protein